MLAHIEGHPYLFAQVLSLAVLLTVLALVGSPPFRRTVILSGIACAPVSLLSILYEQDYWNPVRVWAGPWGPEDLMFAFFAGALSWSLAILGLRHARFRTQRIGVFLRRFHLAGVAGLGVIVLLDLIGCSAMTAVLICCSLITASLLAHRPALWRLAVPGAVRFIPVYFLVVQVHFLLWPAYPTYWQTDRLWSTFIMGFPLGEYLWAIAFGTTWPMLMGYAFGIAPGAGIESRPTVRE